MKKILDWARWEFGRRIEVTTAIRLITLERFLKAVVLIAGGIALLILGARTDLHRFAQTLQDQLDLTGGRGWWAHLYTALVERFTHLTSHQLDAVAVGAILYGLLEAFEGVGLLMRRRWAEYLVLIATAAFLPLEIGELIHKPTVFKAGALLVNLLIIGYLIWRKRLFLERPGEEDADRTEAVPEDLRTAESPAGTPGRRRS